MRLNPPAGAKPFAAGREADVFALGETRVLRRYRIGGDATVEAEVMAYAAGHGYPVPAVYDADGADLVMEWLHGPTMAEACLSGDLSIADGAAILADLLGRLHSLPARTHAGAELGASPGTAAGTGAAARTGEGAGTGAGTGAATGTDAGTGTGAGGQTIVHLDLHPENVVLTGRGPVVIDWRNARDGDGDLDTALSALILAQVAIGSIAHPFGVGAGVMLDRFLEVAPGDPLRLLDDAVGLRSGQLTLSAEEIDMLGTAAARVRKRS